MENVFFFNQNIFQNNSFIPNMSAQRMAWMQF